MGDCMVRGIRNTPTTRVMRNLGYDRRPVVQGPSMVTLQEKCLPPNIWDGDIVLVGGNGLVAAALALPPHKLDRATIISPYGWTKSAHESWYPSPWGQNMQYLPRHLHKIAKKQGFHPNDRMSFANVIMIEELARQELSTKCRLVEMPVGSLSQKDGQVHAAMVDGSQLTFNGHLIINGATTHISSLAFAQKDINVRSSGEMYSLAKGKSDIALALDGLGQNTVWAVRDFGGQRPLVVLYSESDLWRQDLYVEMQGLNKRSGSNHAAPCRMFCIEKSEIVVNSSGHVHVFGKDELSGKDEISTIEPGKFFAARGTQLNTRLVKEGNVLNLQVTRFKPAKEETLRASLSNKVVTYDQKTLDNSHHTPIVPPGNLSQRATKWAWMLGSDISTDPRSINDLERWKKAVVAAATQLKLQVSENFFHGALTAFNYTHQNHVPSEEHLVRAVENMTKGDITEQDGTVVLYSEFCKRIKKLLEKSPTAQRDDTPTDSPPACSGPG